MNEELPINTNKNDAANQQKLIEKLLGTSDCDYVGIGRMVINKDFVVGLPTNNSELTHSKK